MTRYVVLQTEANSAPAHELHQHGPTASQSAQSMHAGQARYMCNMTVPYALYQHFKTQMY